MWATLIFLNNWPYTHQAALDILTQTGLNSPTKLLLINNGASEEDRASAETFVEANSDRVYMWSHCPSLPSLSATWNTALDYFWEIGESYALVANNDIRLKEWSLKYLVKQLVEDEALFVSAIGVTQEQFDKYVEADTETINRAGAGFSCFLISKECHKKYRFDENFIPAYTEDVCVHRRILIAGEGHRAYNINVPYLHYGSGTLKSMSPEAREQVEWQINNISRKYFEKKWGGPVNEETYLKPFGPAPEEGTYCHVTTPDIQTHKCRGFK